ncbi:MAG: universal stress protein [Actinobacteria bacterium ATB1]|nr:universal stress protein [Actinobacteria bacterium ATB1]
MPVYENVLVGTDGSPGSERAVAEAAELARDTGARLTIASSYARQDAEFVPDQNSWHDTTAGRAEDHVLSARELAAGFGVVSHGRTVPASRPGTALVALAEEEEADLVVVGSVGMTGPRRFVLGSVPDHVAHHAHCDVLIVRFDD